MKNSVLDSSPQMRQQERWEEIENNGMNLISIFLSRKKKKKAFKNIQRHSDIFAENYIHGFKSLLC